MQAQKKSKKIQVSQEQVKKVAKLARLEVAAKDLASFTRSFEDTLNWVAKLQEVDVADVPETSQVTGLTNVLRPDEVKPGLKREDFLSGAPAEEADQLKVRAIFSE